MPAVTLATVDDYIVDKINELINVVFPAWSSYLTGVAATGTKKDGFVAPSDLTIEFVSIYSDIAPVGSDLIIDVNKNGTTMFTTQANRPKVVDGNNAGADATPDITSISKGDRIDFDIDQVGSTTPGGNPLRVAIVFGV
jgi:hypothetical protein